MFNLIDTWHQNMEAVSTFEFHTAMKFRYKCIYLMISHFCYLLSQDISNNI